jgi:hypothetical protein
LLRTAFEILDPAEQHPGVGDDPAAGLHDAGEVPQVWQKPRRDGGAPSPVVLDTVEGETQLDYRWITGRLPVKPGGAGPAS